MLIPNTVLQIKTNKHHQKQQQQQKKKGNTTFSKISTTCFNDFAWNGEEKTFKILNIIVTTKTANHPKPPKTFRNHLKPSATTHPKLSAATEPTRNQLETTRTGVTVNIHSPKKALPSTYLLANKYSPVFFSQDKKTPGSVYLPVNKYCLWKYVLPFS